MANVIKIYIQPKPIHLKYLFKFKKIVIHQETFILWKQIF